MAHHHHVVKSVLTEYCAHLAFVDGACHGSGLGLDVDAAVVGGHIFQFGMLVHPEVAHYLIASGYRIGQFAFIALKAAR